MNETECNKLGGIWKDNNCKIEPKEFEIFGYSVGDGSVGIPPVEFCLKTGMHFDEEDRESFMEKSISRGKVIELLKEKLKKHNPYDKKISYIDLLHIMTEDIISELHDNGPVHIHDSLVYTDEW